ncbi:hypothetical protein Mal48_22080 [Thalassoglobus polymorphus]|uniref:Uncharacterized protein n=1 Tax=Thalassoglobus polymorphus TaxID=2527994 RepID=A0A517QMT8_9PLAN|nr:hypothetical protein Mal48_22080 [Thalassoglobus polymorphus]
MHREYTPVLLLVITGQAVAHKEALLGYIRCKHCGPRGRVVVRIEGRSFQNGILKQESVAEFNFLEPVRKPLESSFFSTFERAISSFRTSSNKQVRAIPNSLNQQSVTWGVRLVPGRRGSSLVRQNNSGGH